MLTAAKKKYTAADYEMLQEGAPFQLINSDLVMSPSPSFIHQKIILGIALQIKLYLQERSLKGEVIISPMDVKLSEENIFQPDLLYISEQRKAELIKDRIEGAPDFVVEVLSPSTAYYDLRQKKDTYEKYGVKEYFIVDPIQQNAELHSLDQGRFLLNQKEAKPGIIASVIFPGLKFELEKLFDK